MHHFHAFLAIKYYPGEESKTEIGNVSQALSDASISTFVVVRDVEQYGEIDLGDQNIMQSYSFPQIDKADFVVIEFSEKGVWLWMVAGYCCGAKKPYYLIAKTGSEISPNIGQNAQGIIFYDNPPDITRQFQELVDAGTLI